MEATSSDHSLVKTVASWILLVGLSGAIYWRIHNDPKKKNVVAKTVTQAKQDLGNDVASATAAMKKKADKALKPKSKPAPSRPETATAAVEYDPVAEAAAKRDEAKANQDFAQSFSKLKTGHQFVSGKTEKKRQKSVKQSRAQETDDAPAASPPSSAAGDADDDLSSAASPIAAPVDSTGVSDMLEASSPGPSVLRLTDTDKAPQSSAKKTKAAPAPVETKKQRQNRLKAERKKSEREQDEVERKKLEEAQRRRARIAEGRPAKDGSSFVANKENAWTAKANGDSSAPVQLLDTFEQSAATPVSTSTPKAAVAGNKERSESWMSSLPSEEDQIAQVMEDSSAWNEVTTKKSKKGKKTQEFAPEPATSATPIQASAPAAKTAVNGSKSKPALSSHSSFAALAPEETADDDDVEEEWEV
ncbi:hypothetical protein PFICI_00524 [Pestalotiopsis fici W106-1]|uniref:Uncharacterized protein n=1 Tax=Pestalotiopsis fici (strain W106-1 / CGMCC3.15140) TaxID=1229662 RepID=W3XN46_PESFW|nr:uncharacterized protein PFICI_00524 [Pestalotiopsis fici W106-1]ETS86696.1 hypothetical protein PFICI_00524 [Pestalotiopsis fici W106-1]